MHLESKYPVVVLVVLQRGLPDANVLALGESFELLGQDLGVPDLVGTVDDSHLGSVVIQLNNLENLHLQVEIKLFVVFLLKFKVLKLCNVSAGQHCVVVELFGDPLAHRSQYLHLLCIERELLPEKLLRSELHVL